MKRIVAILLFVVVGVSLLVSLALVQPASAYQDVVYNGGYHLEPSRLQFAGESAGSGYHLLIPGGPSLRGNGCCCANLPCVVKP
jgi:hypothetical protein